MTEAIKTEQTNRFPCPGCGANMTFDPKSQSLSCEYCTAKIDIEKQMGEIQEYDFGSAEDPALANWGNEKRVIHCEACGGETVLDATATAEFCAFCGSSHIVKNDGSAGIAPESLIPFKITRENAAQNFTIWIKKRFFAPNALKKNYRVGKMNGVYIPCWTYDSDTYSTYTAEAGDYYYETVSEWETVNGERKLVTKQVRKIRWRYVSGTYSEFFDDIIVNASKKVDERLMKRLEPFNLEELNHYKPEFLSGFLAERYSVGLKEGWETALNTIKSAIRRGVEREIHADEIRGLNINSRYDNIRFKHILLPVWISGYTYREKIYQFMINAQTGEVQGEAPTSPWKVAGAIVLGAALMALLYFIFIANK